MGGKGLCHRLHWATEQMGSEEVGMMNVVYWIWVDKMEKMPKQVFLHCIFLKDREICGEVAMRERDICWISCRERKLMIEKE